MIDPRLYLVLDPVHGAAHPIDLVRAAASGGVTAVQVRSPAATTRELLAATLGVRDALAGSGVGVVVDDRVDVALAAGVDGVHLGQDDLPPDDARRLAAARHGPFSIGWSVTGAQHVAAARALPAGTVDLLGAGPVHTTATKPDAGEGIGTAALADLVAHAPVATVAIGGITAARAAAVLATGVAGLAVSSAIVDAADPAEAARVLRRAVDRARGAPSGGARG